MAEPHRQTGALNGATDGAQDADITPRPILGLGLGVLVMTSLALLITLGLNQYFVYRRPPPAPPVDARQIPPPPRLQSQASVDLHSLQARQRARLNGYGWIDRSAGVAHIPIERAMELLAAGRSAPKASP